MCVFIFVYRNFNQNGKAHKSGWNCMTVWSWHVGRQRQKHCMFDVEPKLSHNEFVVCPPTIYIITWNAHFKVQRPRCLLLARPYGLHFSRALPSADWRIMNFKVGTPCHPAVHPDWMPGTPIDFSTVCHVKAATRQTDARVAQALRGSFKLRNK